MDKEKRLQIAFFSYYDPLDKRSWSGIPYYLGKALQRNVGDVDFLGPVQPPRVLDKFLRGVAKFSRIFLRSEYITKYSMLLNVYATKVLKNRMKGKVYDMIIAPASAPQLGLLKTNIPIIYFGDSTYHSYSSSYEKEFKNLSKISRWEGDYLEKKALKKSSLIIMTSEWARQSAIQDYGITSSIELIPFGANIDFIPDANDIFEKEKNKILTLLFLAVDWDRKGGAIAYDTLQQLKKKGVHAKLIICGCEPPPEFKDPDMEVIPFLNKNKPEDHARFVQLLSTSHFLLLPTRADCSLIVACEANSYGMPAITTDVGGVSDVVKDGINGYCLPLEASGKEYAELVEKIYADKKGYHELVASSRTRYEDHLNWDKWAQRFLQIYHARFGQVAPPKAVSEKVV